MDKENEMKMEEFLRQMPPVEKRSVESLLMAPRKIKVARKRKSQEALFASNHNDMKMDLKEMVMHNDPLARQLFKPLSSNDYATHELGIVAFDALPDEPPLENPKKKFKLDLMANAAATEPQQPKAKKMAYAVVAATEPQQPLSFPKAKPIAMAMGIPAAPFWDMLRYRNPPTDDMGDTLAEDKKPMPPPKVYSHKKQQQILKSTLNITDYPTQPMSTLSLGTISMRNAVKKQLFVEEKQQLIAKEEARLQQQPLLQAQPINANEPAFVDMPGYQIMPKLGDKTNQFFTYNKKRMGSKARKFLEF